MDNGCLTSAWLPACWAAPRLQQHAACAAMGYAWLHRIQPDKAVKGAASCRHGSTTQDAQLRATSMQCSVLGTARSKARMQGLLQQAG